MHCDDQKFHLLFTASKSLSFVCDIPSLDLTMVPTGTGNQGKPGKMGRHFPVREFCQDWKSQGILLKILGKLGKIYWKIEKITGKVREIYQPVIVKTLQIWYHTLNKNEL